MARADAGRRDAELSFDAFMRRQWVPMLRAACLLTGDEPSAEDLLQSAFAKLWLSWTKVQRGAPEPYLRRILFTSHVSAQRRRWIGERPSAQLPEVLAPDASAAVTERQSLAVALRSLTPRQRAVVVLRYFEDLSEKDTAAALGCSVGTVKTLASRAMERLREVPGLADAAEADDVKSGERS